MAAGDNYDEVGLIMEIFALKLTTTPSGQSKVSGGHVQELFTKYSPNPICNTVTVFFLILQD
ncbi:hypothetical protein MHIR_DE00651 [Candidatus Doolittlea endobia]|uniref:Uncharacterized protein n=1 Tax=Candidatus Doolittlea endobia TaxID=1778262 RepID=A0A143WT19_9ENTR|nr:hypothetical protein MHIR_DE00651 [Candidatus Doolittlea endobia]